LGARGSHGRALEGGGGHSRVVDDPVDHHVGYFREDGHRICGHLGDLPSQLIWLGEDCAGRLNTYSVLDH
jgi:hypothetical protein